MVIHKSIIKKECPVCGRPVQINTRFLGHQVVCDHCRGEFTVYQADDKINRLESASIRALQEADRILASLQSESTLPAGEKDAKQFQLISENDVVSEINKADLLDWEMKAIPLSQPVKNRNIKPIALVVEPRDEVFARIAYDVAEVGMRVIRAKTAAEALKISRIGKPKLVVAYTKLLDQSGWLLASKLLIGKPKLKVWLYQSKFNENSQAMARYLQIDHLLEYGGDLQKLSTSVHQLLADRRETNSLFCENYNIKMQSIA